MEHEQQQEAVGKARVPSPQCPRCDSTHTKFCYFNNYSMSQPRYLCKNCRRYWTQGGTLRNIPQGGGGLGRKGRRSKRSPTAAAAASATATAMATATSNNNSPPQLLLDEDVEVEPSITASPMPFGDGLDAPPVLPSLYYDGDGLGGGMIGDLAMPPPFDHQFFYGRNFQPAQQHGYQLIPQPRAPSAIPLQGWQYQTQQLNNALFATTNTITTGPTIPNTAAAAGTGDQGEVYWRGLINEEGFGGWGGDM